MKSSEPPPPQFRCPRCHGELREPGDAYHCPRCPADYPVIAGIPDFRLWPDPYIGIEADRRKARHLAEQSRTRSFEQMLHYYYSITPEDPPDLARGWTAHALAEPRLAAYLLNEAAVPGGGPLIDIGCSTGGLLVAARDRSPVLTGVDVALRWLTIGAVRLREQGSDATLVCANAEALPFAEGSFSVATATDVLEHLRDAPLALSEVRRVLGPGGETVWTTNNRYAPLPEPHVKLWGVGWLPRRHQAGYVAWRRRDLLRYQIVLRGSGETRRLFRTAGFDEVELKPAPHAEAPALYEWLRRQPLTAALLTDWGPKLMVRARRR